MKLNKDQVQQLITNRPQNVQPEEVLRGLVKRGIQFEGMEQLPKEVVQEAKRGSGSFTERLKASFGTQEEKKAAGNKPGFDVGDVGAAVGGLLPLAGSIAGGIIGAPTLAGGVATSAAGGATGEAIRVSIGRLLGQQKDVTTKGALAQIGKEGALSAAGEGIGRGVVGAVKAVNKVLPGVLGITTGKGSKIFEAIRENPKVAPLYNTYESATRIGADIAEQAKNVSLAIHKEAIKEITEQAPSAMKKGSIKSAATKALNSLRGVIAKPSKTGRVVVKYGDTKLTDLGKKEITKAVSEINKWKDMSPQGVMELGDKLRSIADKVNKDGEKNAYNAILNMVKSTEELLPGDLKILARNVGDALHKQNVISRIIAPASKKTRKIDPIIAEKRLSQLFQKGSESSQKIIRDIASGKWQRQLLEGIGPANTPKAQALAQQANELTKSAQELLPAAAGAETAEYVGQVLRSISATSGSIGGTVAGLMSGPTLGGIVGGPGGVIIGAGISGIALLTSLATTSPRIARGIVSSAALLNEFAQKAGVTPQVAARILLQGGTRGVDKVLTE